MKRPSCPAEDFLTFSTHLAIILHAGTGFISKQISPAHYSMLNGTG